MKKTAILVVLFFTTFTFSQSDKSKQNKSSKPFVIGSIEEIYSTELSEKRTLNIYFPEGYQQNDTLKYPVIYLLDGSADEDFIHVVGLFQFNNLENSIT